MKKYQNGPNFKNTLDKTYFNLLNCEYLSFNFWQHYGSAMVTDTTNSLTESMGQ